MESDTEGANGDPARKILASLERHAGATNNSTQRSPELQFLDAAQGRFGFNLTGDDQSQEGSFGSRALNRLKGIGNFFWGSRNRRIASIGGAGGIGGIIGVLSLFGVVQGPLEFVHIAEMLTDLHFGHLQAASDLRVGKMVYKLVTGKGDGVDFGDTRLKIFGEVKFKNAILADLKSKGIEPDLGHFKTFKGFTVDTNATVTDPNTGEPVAANKYAGMSQEDAIHQLSVDLGGDGSANISGKGTITAGLNADGAWDGTLHVSSDNFFGEPSLISGMVKVSGRSGLGAWIRARTLIRYTEASNFHPIRKLDAKINEKIADLVKQWAEQRNQDLENGIEASSADSTAAESQSTDPQTGKTTDTPVPETSDGPLSSSNVSSVLDSIKGAGTALAITGIGVAVICALKTLADNIGVLQYTQVILPMTRMAMNWISAGNQIKAGQDLDQHELAYMANELNTIDPKTGRVLSSWNDAAPLNNAYGYTGGIDISPAIKDAFNGVPSWLQWTGAGIVGQLCSTAGQVIAGAVSVVIGVFTGGIATAVFGLVQGALIGVGTSAVINYLSGILAGNAVNVNATGAELGNDLDYGARAAANAEAIQFGGVALTSKQVAELNAQQQATNAAEFHSESLADRLFNPSDYRSIVGNMIDRLNVTGPQTLLARITDIPAVIGALFSMPSAIFDANVQAAAIPYNYPAGFPEFGFSEEDQNNPLVQDPAANAKAVGQLLDNNNTNGEPDYIQKALDCFGISITMTPDGWDAVPSTVSASDGQDRTYGVNAYDTNSSQGYDQQGCIDSSDSNWLRIRFWIFDTGAMEGYACYLGDTTSCVNDGFSG